MKRHFCRYNKYCSFVHCRGIYLGVSVAAVSFALFQALASLLTALRLFFVSKHPGTEKGPPEALPRGHDGRGNLPHDAADAPHQGGSHMNYQRAECGRRRVAERNAGPGPRHADKWRNNSREHGCEREPVRTPGMDAPGDASPAEGGPGGSDTTHF